MKASEVKIGQAFGAATVIAEAPPLNSRRRVVVECWACKEPREVYAHNLVSGHANHCKGCRERNRRTKKAGMYTHSLNRAQRARLLRKQSEGDAT